MLHILFFSGLNGHVHIFNRYIGYVWHFAHVLAMLKASAEFQRQYDILDLCLKGWSKHESQKRVTRGYT